MSNASKRAKALHRTKGLWGREGNHHPVTIDTLQSATPADTVSAQL
jgi:hypothetical protein